MEGILMTGAADVLGLAGVYGAEDPTSVAKSILLFALHTAIVEANAHGQPQGTTLHKPGRSQPESGEEDREPASKRVSVSLYVSLCLCWCGWDIIQRVIELDCYWATGMHTDP